MNSAVDFPPVPAGSNATPVDTYGPREVQRRRHSHTGPHFSPTELEQISVCGRELPSLWWFVTEGRHANTRTPASKANVPSFSIFINFHNHYIFRAKNSYSNNSSATASFFLIRKGWFPNNTYHCYYSGWWYSSQWIQARSYWNSCPVPSVT